MSLGFDNIPERKGYIRQAGVQLNARLVSLTYNATEAYEYFDIEIETTDGKMFRERTFGANIDKVFPKDKWEAGKNIGQETMQEAYDRVQDEISKKLFWLALTRVSDTAELKGKVGNAKDLKDLVTKVNSVIGDLSTFPRINFLAMWKNSDTKQRSNLILADRCRWCEPTQYTPDGVPMAASLIKFSPYQLSNGMVEKYPYIANKQEVAEAATAIAGSDLPF